MAVEKRSILMILSDIHLIMFASKIQASKDIVSRLLGIYIILFCSRELEGRAQKKKKKKST